MHLFENIYRIFPKVYSSCQNTAIGTVAREVRKAGSWFPPLFNETLTFECNLGGGYYGWYLLGDLMTFSCFCACILMIGRLNCFVLSAEVKQPGQN